jgi:5-methyltetrahydropteroyltriglutamate--homocysteine methyltransferase
MTTSQRFAQTRFASGVVGILPRPMMVREMLPQTPGPASAEAARSKQMDAAVHYAIAMQELAGLDLVSDGEWRRHAYTHIIADIATGFTADLRTEPHRWGISITEPMQVVKPGLIAEEARFLVAATDRMTKVCVPSPYLLVIRLWEQGVSSKAYPSRDGFIEEVAAILREELLALQETGVAVVQVDEPHMCVLVDPSYRDSFEDAQFEMDLSADMINGMLTSIDKVQTALHLCRRNYGRRGWGAEGGYEPIIETMKKIQVDQYVMEFSIPVAGDVAILTAVAPGQADRPGGRGVPLRKDRHHRTDRRSCRGSYEAHRQGPRQHQPRLWVRTRPGNGHVPGGTLPEALQRGGGVGAAAGEVRLSWAA